MLHPDANLDRIQLWVDGLLSGKFKQGTGYLAYQLPDGTFEYCCLGVACEIAIAHGLQIDREVSTEPMANDALPVYFAWGRYLLPDPVMQWYGIHGDTAVELVLPSSLDKVPRETTAAQINDELRVSYRGIARILAANFDLPDVPDGE